MTDDTLLIPLVPARRFAYATQAPSGLLLADTRLRRTGPADPVGSTLTEALADHEERLGLRPHGSAGLLELVDEAGLTGHGGAHVPAVLKWRSVLRGHGPLTVVANGAESEPIAAKDGTLLRQRPHLVLDGLEILAETLGAQRAVLWLHGDDDGARRSVERALAERYGPGHLQAPHGFREAVRRVPGVRVEIVSGPSHYLSGEASAIVRALSGGPALPTVRRRATDPTAPRSLVHNVETLARLAVVARGLPAPSTRLLSVLSGSPDQGRFVVEVPTSTTFTELLEGLGEPMHPSAVLLGGYGGRWERWESVADLPVDEAALRRAGTSLGAGVVAPLAREACGVRQTAAVVAYLASMSARQCGPCVFGLPALAAGLADLAAATGGRSVVGTLLDDAAAVEGRGACHHPDGATGLVASAVETFRADVEAHAAGRACQHSRQVVLPGLST